MAPINPSIQQLVQQAEEMCANESVAFARRRSDHRFQMGGVEAPCTVQQPGGTVTTQSAMLIDLSASGGQLIYPGYVHPCSELTLDLLLPSRRPITIEGRAMWCRLLGGRHHLIGLGANERLPIRDLVSAEEWLDACAKDPDLQTPIGGSMVVLTDDAMLATSITFHLSQTKITSEQADTRGALLDKVARSEMQILAIDADCDGANASEVLAECRGRSFEGPVILLSADHEAEFLAKMDPIGRTEFVQLPIRDGALASAIRQIVREHPECLQSAKPIYSDLPACPDRERWLGDFIESARLTCKQATAAIEQEDVPSVQKTVASLARHAGSYGYPDLAEAADTVLRAVESEPRKLPALLTTLAAVIDRLEPGEASAA